MTSPSGNSADLVIIGGGIHGCSTAMFAAQRGMSVILIEKDTVARHASGVNAGGVRRLGRALPEIPISQHSMNIWYKLPDMVEDDCGFQIAPQVKVAETEEQMDELRARVRSVKEMGFSHEEILDSDAVRALLPAASDHIEGGLVSRQDGFAQPYQTTFAISRCARRNGARIIEGEAVRSLRQNGSDWEIRTDAQSYRARKVVNCAGAWAGALAESLGEKAPVIATAPMMLVSARLPRFCDAVVSAAGRPLSFKQMPNGTVVIGGGRLGRADTATNLSETIFPELRRTAEAAIDIFPIMCRATIVRSWAGVEGRMPDQIPVIGPSLLHEGLYHSFGYSSHGFQLGPGVGQIMAELAATGKTDKPIAPFSIGRFLPKPANGRL